MTFSRFKLLNFGAQEDRFWSRNHKILLCVLALIFLASVPLKIHGYSFGMWQKILGHPVAGVIEGEMQAIRSDDWTIVLPLGITETADNVRFDCNVSLIGHGMSSLLLSRSLCLSGMGWLSALFKPWTWGYGLGPDFGLSWMWWFLVLGLSYSVFICLYHISGRRLLFSLFAALGFAFAPYHQFWSLNQAEIYMAGFGILAFFGALLHAQSHQSRIMYASGVLYCGLAFTLPLYPPTQVMVAYFVVLSSLVYWFAYRRMTSVSFVLALFFALAFYFGILAALAKQAFPTIELMANTVYPGKRFSMGGGWPWGRFFVGLLTPYQTTKNWLPLGNICEAASFILIGPIMICLLPKIGKVNDRLKVSLLAVAVSSMVFLIYYMSVGIPRALAKLSFLSFVPTMRVVSGLGLWDLCIWTLGALILHENRGRIKFRYPDLIWFVPWIAILILTAIFLHGALGAPWPKLLVLITIGICFCWIAAKSPLSLSLAFFLTSYSLTNFFNPTVRGGFDVLKQDPLVQTIQDVSSKFPGENWVVGDAQFKYGNLIRMFGHSSISGTYYYPQFDLWKKFDPENRYINSYNRYAHVDFDLRGSMMPRIILREPDAFGIKVDPRYPAFEEEKVRLFLVKDDAPFQGEDFELIATSNDWKVFRRRVGLN